MTAALEDLLVGFADTDPTDLRSRLQWIEDASSAASRAAVDLGKPAEQAALYLRASLGAFVEFSRGAQGQTELVALEAATRTLIAQALYDLYGALADAYRELGKAEGDVPHRAECRELSRLWSTLQVTIKKGQPIRPDILRKLDSIRARVER